MFEKHTTLKVPESPKPMVMQPEEITKQLNEKPGTLENVKDFIGKNKPASAAAAAALAAGIGAVAFRKRIAKAYKDITKKKK